MKRIFALCAMLAFAVMAMAGCGGNSAAPAGSGSKVLKVGSSIDFAPFEFQDETQKDYQGFDMDLIRAVGKELGYEVEIQNIGFDGLIKCVFSGFECRLCADAKAPVHELRFHPYLFPVGLGGLPTFSEGGHPEKDAMEYWLHVRRALVREPVETDCSALVRVCLAYAGIDTCNFNTET